MQLSRPDTFNEVCLDVHVCVYVHELCYLDGMTSYHIISNPIPSCDDKHRKEVRQGQMR
jgi:hypothetical protein